MGAQSIWVSRVTVKGDISGTATDVTVVSQADVTSDPLEKAWADLGNWGTAMPTVHVYDAVTRDSSGANITNAPMKIVLNTIDNIRNYEVGGPDPAPDGASWVVDEFDVLDVSTLTSPQSNRWFRIVTTTRDADNSSTTHPVARWLWFTVEVESGGTAGTFEVTLEIFLTVKDPA